MFYQSVENEELTKFLEKYPEYKPENDPNNINWNVLERELGWMKKPVNPHLIGDMLERARKMATGFVAPSDHGLPEKKRQVQLASVGSVGTQRSSSSPKTLSSQQREIYERGGWTEEEIKSIEANL